MKFFWPSRANAKGFSIGNLSLKYNDKTAKVSSIEIQNKCTVGSSLRSKNKDINYVESNVISRKKVHWANRDFSEYEDVA